MLGTQDVSIKDDTGLEADAAQGCRPALGSTHKPGCSQRPEQQAATSKLGSQRACLLAAYLHQWVSCWTHLHEQQAACQEAGCHSWGTPAWAVPQGERNGAAHRSLGLASCRGQRGGGRVGQAALCPQSSGQAGPCFQTCPMLSKFAAAVMLTSGRSIKHLKVPEANMCPGFLGSGPTDLNHTQQAVAGVQHGEKKGEV